MREIFFKAIDVHSGKWVYGYPKLFVDVRPVMMTNMGDRIIARKTVCQFTGFTDVNKKRIFDGDTMANMMQVYMSNSGKWMARRLDWRDRPGNSAFYTLSDVACMFEVTGNIHDK